MGEYFLDITEYYEAGAEAWAEENVRGDEFKCSCGNWCKIEDGETVSANPWASPVCTECFEKWWKENAKEEEDTSHA